MRLFIAVKFEQNIIDELTSIQNALRTLNFKGRYSSVENLHLTLAFIGEYQNPDDVINAMEKIQCKQFDISLSGYLGNFGNLIWAGMERTPELDSYAKKLRYALADSNIPFDKKNFNP
ncbi:MAG: RNA 2',3'-cyclic phosphodiesterase, partial [Clostridia bacterium]|nr:RNA 2',3'-cyclic phosphodiesterase [Clostridia bacterium]